MYRIIKRFKKFKWHLIFKSVIIIVISVLLVTCKKEDQIMNNKIYIQPETIQLYENEQSKIKLFVNSKEDVEWQLAYASPLLRVEPSGGKVNDKGIEISISLTNNNLPEGYIYFPLSFIVSGSGIFEVNARVYISAIYQYVFIKDSVVIQDNEASVNVGLINLSNVSFVPSLVSDKQWAIPTLNASSFPPYSVLYAKVNFEKRMVHAGWNEALISITKNSPEAIPLKVHYFVKPFTLLEASIKNLELYFDQDTSFYLINAGTERLDWEIQNQNPFLLVSPESGSFNSGDSTLIHVQAIDSIQSYGVYDGPIIATYAGSTQSVNIQTQLKYYQTNVLPQYSRLVDVVYNEELNELVAITRMENEIRIVNAETNELRKTSLDDAPSGICLFNNNQQIAVGIAGEVLIFNYQTLELIRRVQLVLDNLTPKHIHEGINGNLFFNYTNYATLQYINTENWTIYSYTPNLLANFTDRHFALNPSFPAIFKSGGSDIAQFKLDETSITFIKSQVYNHLMQKSFISSDGNMLILDIGYQYALSPDEAETLIYTGEIMAERIRDLQYLNQNQHIAWIEAEQSTFVTIADLQSQKNRHIINLPYLDIIHNGQSLVRPPDGSYVFFNKNKNTLISVATYLNNKYDSPQWGIHSSFLNQ